MRIKELEKISYWFLMVVLLTPFLYGIFYAIPSADDFDYAMAVGYHGDRSTPFAEAIGFATFFWKTWSGNWLCTFIANLLNPLKLFGYGSVGYGIELCLFFVLFIVACLWSINRILPLATGIKNKWATFLILAALLCGYVYQEMYYWWMGVTTYQIFAMLGIITIALTLLYFRNRSWWMFLLITLCGTLGCMQFTTCVPIGLFYLVICFGNCLREKRRDWYLLIPFICFVLAGASLAFSPGALNRNAGSSVVGGLNFGLALYHTVYGFWLRLYTGITNPIIVVTFVVLLAIGIYSNLKEKEELKNPLWLIIVNLLAGFGAVFPVCMGYGNSDIPNRACFIVDMTLVISFSVFFVMLGRYYAYRYELSFLRGYNRLIVAFGIVLFAYSAIVASDAYQESPWIIQIAKFREIKAEREYWIDVLDEIAASTDAEVVVKRPRFDSVGISLHTQIMEDSEEWPSYSIAMFFGKDSLRMEYIEEDR